ncbi:uncharacterized protein LOC111788735 [Cucurbita pepo subsp. pepo]|uniref:uncharacterized protein LOC111788735 n=1 Tax=Cucurbita pepo subsp. pepo TaxID=3664 RepID=UPI000C9D5BDC|nr:uncharacterized protein LOC111788735 [Cucurbita pepo subsp. pepo]
MANSPDVDADDEFSELYKEYTGPPRSTAVVVQDKTNTNKRSHGGFDEEDGPRDPNAVPTDFTSREAKVWEAKSKATERNWKKRKEEEMVCKICGESGHFTQGCPSTLGSNRKAQDFFERVPARDKHVRALFTDRVVQKIEKDIGCKIKMDEKFIIVSGKDRLILVKGVDAVHKMIKEEGDQKGFSSSRMSRSRSPERSPVGSRSQRSDIRRSHSGPTNASQFQPRFSRQEKAVENRIRDDLQKYPRGSVQAYSNDRVRGRSSHSKSPAHPPYSGSSFSSYDSYQNKSAYGRMEGWDSERRGSDLQTSHQFEYPAFPQSLEELEMEYKREATELGKIRDKEEDDENYKHRETIREMRENYTKKLAHLRGTHAKQWDEFHQLDAQRRQQQVHQHMAASGFAGYKQHNYSEYEGGSVNSHYEGATNLAALDSRSKYPNHMMENFPSRPHGSFGEFQRQRHDDYGNAYKRY